MLGKDSNYSSDEFGEEEKDSLKVWESNERNRESRNFLSSHHNENAGQEKKRTKVLDEETAASHMSVKPGVSHCST